MAKIIMVALAAARSQDTVIGLGGEILPKASAKVPYALVGPMVWNRGTDMEKTLMTLHMIRVPAKMRGQGVGGQLLADVIAWMRANSVKTLAFDNFDEDFWLSAAKKFPKNVVMSKRHRGRSYVGIVRSRANVNVEGLLW